MIFAQTGQKGWRGPERNGIYVETGLLKEWATDGPDLLWETEIIGKGYSSAVIANDKIYITGMSEEGNKEILSAFSLDGKQIFQVEYGASWDKSFPETRTTPTIVDDNLFVISGSGEVVCLNIADGTIKWKIDAGTEYKRKTGTWGTSECPLVYDNKVVYTPGGERTTVIALNKDDGSLLWETEALNDESGYVSPLLINHNGKRQIISITAHWFLGINPDNGKIEWKIPMIISENNTWAKSGNYDGRHTTLVNTPIYHNGKIFVTNGYDQGSFLVQLNDDATNITVVWKNETLDTHHGGVVLFEGKLYGSNWENNSKGNWCSVDWETGKSLYDEPWSGKGKGSIIFADGMLYCYDEKAGFVGLVKPADKFDVVSQFKIKKGSGPFWAHPVIDNGKLYIRHGEALMVYAIK
jgi:outer membrane protein assembly factor BamB